jgi:hypothetical protein
MGKFYKRVGQGQYRSTQYVRHYPKSDLKFWRSLIGFSNEFICVGMSTGTGYHGTKKVFVEIRGGAPFNGATGYFDLVKLMRAVLFHDQLVEECVPSSKKNPLLQTTEARRASNRVFRDIAKEDGSDFRAVFLYKMVKAYTRIFVN